MYHTNIVCVYF